MPGFVKAVPSTPFPDEADAERMHKYIQDRRVVGVRKSLLSQSLSDEFSVSSSPPVYIPNDTNTSSPSPPELSSSSSSSSLSSLSTGSSNGVLNDEQYDPLIQPALIRHEITSSPTAQSTIARARYQASRIIAGEDDRMIVVVGPCSIHSPEQAIEYAKMLKEDIPKWDGLLVIMRSYL